MSASIFQHTVPLHRPFELLQPSRVGWPKSAKPAIDFDEEDKNRASSTAAAVQDIQNAKSLEYKGQPYLKISSNQDHLCA